MQKKPVFIPGLSAQPSLEGWGHSQARACCRSAGPPGGPGGSAHAQDGRVGARTGRVRPHQARPRAALPPAHHAWFPCASAPRSGPVSSSVSRDALLREAPEVSRYPARSPRGPEAGGSEGPAEAWSLPGSSDSTGQRYFTTATGSPLAAEPERVEGHLNWACRRCKTALSSKAINIFRDDMSWEVDGEGDLPSNFLRSSFKNFPERPACPLMTGIAILGAAV